MRKVKVLYITPMGNRKNYYLNREFNLTEISSLISNGVLQEFKNIEITFPREIATEMGNLPEKEFSKFDLYLCDLTTANPSVTFAAGVAEGLGKPIIYFVSNDDAVIAAIRHKKHLIYSEASLKGEFQKELNEIIKEAIKDPNDFKSFIPKHKEVQKAFICYSHANKDYLDRLLVHLKPLERNGLLDVWEDSKIKTGDQWEEKIEKALQSSNIAILLISADFMASEFIVKNELPPILSKAEIQGTKIVPIIISPCRFNREPNLNRFQSVNPPNKPLSKMDENDRESIYDKVSEEIEKSIKSI